MAYFSTINSGYQSNPNDWVEFLNCVSQKSKYGIENKLFEKKDDKFWAQIEADVSFPR
ncbi:hypothetical protein ACO0LM_02405 [Undibacterium sp. Di26W]|uniref:hypothetical protein n=1 Tax=Undibacterium sp. Di26W TaxID=3413035 RepID=UPI003BF163FC